MPATPKKEKTQKKAQQPTQPIKWKSGNERESKQAFERPAAPKKIRRKPDENPYLYTGPDAQRRVEEIEQNSLLEDEQPEEKLEDALKLPRKGVLPNKKELKPYYPTRVELETHTERVCDIVKNDLTISMAIHETIRKWSVINRNDDLNFGDSADLESTLLTYGMKLSKLAALESLLGVYGLSEATTQRVLDNETNRLFPPPKEMPQQKQRQIQTTPVEVELGDKLLSGL